MMGHALTILLVEDNADDVLLTQRALAQAGLSGPVHVVRDGGDAIAYLQGSPPFEDRGRHPLPDLLVLDLKMPGIDGFEVLAWVRERPELKSMLIAVLSGFERPQYTERTDALGADFYIVKPCNYRELANRLERLMRLSALKMATLAAQQSTTRPEIR